MSKKHKKITRKMKTGGAPITVVSITSVPLNAEEISKIEPEVPMCPRCNDHWCNKYSVRPECKKCNMFYEKHPPYRIRLVLNEEISLVWRHEHNDTIVWFKSKLDPLPLPWLPFTITEEKLKLYLVFS